MPRSTATAARRTLRLTQRRCVPAKNCEREQIRMRQPSLRPATESSCPTTLYGVPWWQSAQSLQQAQWRTPAQARQRWDQAAATSREQNFLVAGTLVSGPFRAAVGVLKKPGSLVAGQFRTPPPSAQASLPAQGAK